MPCLKRLITMRALSRGEEKVKGVVNRQNSQDKGPPEGNSARG